MADVRKSNRMYEGTRPAIIADLRISRNSNDKLGGDTHPPC